MLRPLLTVLVAACVTLLSVASALATPPTFTYGYIVGDNIYDTPGFRAYVTGPPNTSWTIYSLPEGNYVSDPQVIGTLEINSAGTGYFEDDSAGSFDWSSQFYQLVNGDESSAIFGYTLVNIIEPDDNNSTGAAIQNPLIPLSPGTVNSDLISFWHISDGTVFTPVYGRFCS